MSKWTAVTDLAEIIAEELMKGREDSRPASMAIANAIEELIEQSIEAEKRYEK